jgi:hypothetical protein
MNQKLYVAENNAVGTKLFSILAGLGFGFKLRDEIWISSIIPTPKHVTVHEHKKNRNHFYNWYSVRPLAFRTRTANWMAQPCPYRSLYPRRIIIERYKPPQKSASWHSTYALNNIALSLIIKLMLSDALSACACNKLSYVFDLYVCYRSSPCLIIHFVHTNIK